MCAVTAWIHSSGSKMRTVAPVRGIRGRLDLETAVLAPADTVDRKRRASDVARDALEALSVFGGNDIVGEDGKARMHPSEQVVHEALR